jgi:hypothetical protein
MAVLKAIVDFFTLLIGAEGAKTPAGVRGRGDPAGAKSAEAPRNAKRLEWKSTDKFTQPLLYKYMFQNKGM